MAYSDDLTGPFTLDIDGENYPVTPTAKGLLILRDVALQACTKGKEVKVSNANDLVVYHSLGTKVIHPNPIGNFWKVIVK